MYENRPINQAPRSPGIPEFITVEAARQEEASIRAQLQQHQEETMSEIRDAIQATATTERKVGRLEGFIGGLGGLWVGFHAAMFIREFALWMASR